MSTEQQKEEIERIIRELITRYGNEFIARKHEIYYKIGGKIRRKEIKYSDYCEPVPIPEFDYEYPCILEGLILKMRQLASLNPEFVLYVDFTDVIIPENNLNDCVEYGLLLVGSLAEQFLPSLLQPQRTDYAKLFLKHVFDKDPLTQVLDYATLKLGSPNRLYVCPEVYFIKQEHGDLGYLSMVSAKSGVVAYCTTFDNYKYKVASGEWRLLNKKLRSLWQHIRRKIVDYRERLKSLSKEERKKYCDVYAIKDLFSKEIEEADKLIREYGIIRVTFSLE